jgi:hypothetical protein
MIEELVQSVAERSLANSDALCMLQGHFHSMVQNMCSWQQSAARQLAKLSHHLNLAAQQLPDIPFDLIHTGSSL